MKTRWNVFLNDDRDSSAKKNVKRKELHTDGFRFQAEVEECVIISKSTTVTWSH